jgi:hypothetical protein
MAATTSERRRVNVCDLCSAIWDGPTPPKQCPGCKAHPNWRAADVAKQKGVVGGRTFVAGTETPMTRIFFCEGCAKMVVSRRGEPPPEVCPNEACEDREKGFREAQPTGKMEIEPPPENATPAEVKAAARGALPKSLRKSEVDLTSEASTAKEARAVVARAFFQAPDHIPEPEPMTAEEYRSQWLAERVAAMVDHADVEALQAVRPEEWWNVAQYVYDEGRRRGHLP